MRLASAWLFTVVFITATCISAPAARKPKVQAAPEAEVADLAGTYYEGTGLYGTVLTLHPEGWFHFTTSRDALGVPNKRNLGMFWSWNGVLILKPNLPVRADEQWEQLPTRLFPVQWGKRRYLLRPDADSIREFCNAVNLGQEPRSFFAGPYLRTGDEKIPVTGFPSLP